MKIYCNIKNETIEQIVVDAILDSPNPDLPIVINDSNEINETTNSIYIVQIYSLQEIITLEKNKQKWRKIKLVLLCDKESLVFETFSLGILYFIRIAHVEKDVKECIKIINGIDKKHKLTLSIGENKAQIIKENIEYIESMGHYLYIHYRDTEFRIRKSMKEMLAELASDTFIQIHKSFIVNTSYIIKFNSQNVILSNATLPIGRSYKQIFIQEIESYR